jgi:hypothetical protein
MKHCQHQSTIGYFAPAWVPETLPRLGRCKRYERSLRSARNGQTADACSQAELSIADSGLGGLVRSRSEGVAKIPPIRDIPISYVTRYKPVLLSREHLAFAPHVCHGNAWDHVDQSIIHIISIWWITEAAIRLNLKLTPCLSLTGISSIYFDTCLPGCSRGNGPRATVPMTRSSWLEQTPCASGLRYSATRRFTGNSAVSQLVNIVDLEWRYPRSFYSIYTSPSQTCKASSLSESYGRFRVFPSSHSPHCSRIASGGQKASQPKLHQIGEGPGINSSVPFVWLFLPDTPIHWSVNDPPVDPASCRGHWHKVSPPILCLPSCFRCPFFSPSLVTRSILSITFPLPAGFNSCPQSARSPAAVATRFATSLHVPSLISRLPSSNGAGLPHPFRYGSIQTRAEQ